MSFIDDQDATRRAKTQDIALFRYRLIAPALEPGLTGGRRGRLVRGIAAQVHAGPAGGRPGVPQEPGPVDRGLAGGRVRGAVPSPRQWHRGPRRRCWSWRRR